MKSGKSIITFLLLTTLALAGINQANAGEGIQGVAHKVLDSKTVQIRIGQKIRDFTLAGIDQTTTQAKSYLEKSLLTNSIRIFQPINEEAFLIREKDEVLINEQLIRNGYASFKKSGFHPFDKQMQKAQTLAQEAELGIWQPETKKQTNTKTKSIKDRAPPQEDIVYITKTGKKYHRQGCRYLKQSKIAIEREEAQKYYTPCKVCRP